MSKFDEYPEWDKDLRNLANSLIRLSIPKDLITETGYLTGIEKVRFLEHYEDLRKIKDKRGY